MESFNKSIIISEISSLQAKIDKHSLEQRILSREVESLEASIKNFVDTYFQEISYLIDPNLEKKQKPSQEYSDLEEIEPDKLEKEKLIDTELKSVYRKLVRICHPDIASIGKNEKEIFFMINEAYNDRDLASLIKLEKILCDEQESEHESKSSELSYIENHLQSLRTEYASIINEIEKLKLKKDNLVYSSANVLMRKITIAKIHGKDLIEEIKEEMIKSMTSGD